MQNNLDLDIFGEVPDYRVIQLTLWSINQKVLLRERKRHTARHVSSARYAALSNGWGAGGTPASPGGGGYPPYHLDLALEGGYPI